MKSIKCEDVEQVIHVSVGIQQNDDNDIRFKIWELGWASISLDTGQTVGSFAMTEEKTDNDHYFPLHPIPLFYTNLPLLLKQNSLSLKAISNEYIKIIIGLIIKIINTIRQIY